MLEAGDAFTGSGELGDHTHGEAIVAAFNVMELDVLALGPKDLAVGRDALAERLSEARFQVVSANAYDEDGRRRVTGPIAWVERGGHTIAVVGLTRVEPAAGFVVREPLAELQQVMPDVLARTNAVILLTNIAFEDAQGLARAVPEIDLIVGGLPGALPDHAVEVPGSGALAVVAEKPQPGHTGRRVGRLSVMLQPDGTFVDPDWATVSLGPEIADDPEMKRVLEGFSIQ